ncbi:hypothetical protein C8R43DRAFT_942952 [Mycena crocata]|nr:hypothetical protein C8R43DRAFT_942952 [Mycena crocata]
MTAPKGSSLEAFEAARKAGATSEEASAASGAVRLEEQEPSREEEGAAREAEARRLRIADEEDSEDGWVDEEADEEEGRAANETIGQRVRARRGRRQATRTLPGGGGQMR